MTHFGSRQRRTPSPRVVRLLAAVVVLVCSSLVFATNAQASTRLPVFSETWPHYTTSTHGAGGNVHWTGHFVTNVNSNPVPAGQCWRAYITLYGGTSGISDPLASGSTDQASATWCTPSGGGAATAADYADGIFSGNGGDHWCIWRFDNPTSSSGAKIATDGCASWALLDTRPESTCDDFVDVQGSMVGTTFTLSFKWSGTPPAGGWRFYTPDFGVTASRPGSPTGTVPVTIDTAGRYNGFATVTPDPSSFVVESTADPYCYWAGYTDGVAGGTVEYGSDDDGTSCGLNPFCYIKAALRWAFVPPSDASTRWQNNLSAARTHFPVNVMIAGADYFTVFKDGLACEQVSESCSNPHSPAMPDVAFAQAPGLNSHGDVTTVSFLTGVNAGAATGGGEYARRLIAVGIWASALFIIWHRIAASFGGKS